VAISAPPLVTDISDAFAGVVVNAVILAPAIRAGAHPRRRPVEVTG